MMRSRIKDITLFDRILILLAVLGVIFFAYVFFRKATYITATIKVGDDNILYQPWKSGEGSRIWFAELFHEGMKETDGLGRVGAEVISVYSYNTSFATKAVYLTTKLKAVYNRATNQYTFKGMPLSVGSTIRLNMDNLFIDGLVTDIEGMDDPRKKVTLIVNAQIVEENPTFPETSGTSENIANALKTGDVVKDSRGNTVIKILDKKVENAKRLVTTGSGNLYIGTHPLRYDVYLTLEVNAIEIAGGYYLFDDVPILIGKTIPINTSIVSVTPEVTNIKLAD